MLPRNARGCREELEIRYLLTFRCPVLFVGVNPSSMAPISGRGHFFGGRGNIFWKCLCDSGLVSQTFTAEDDEKVFEQYGIGFLNMVSRPTRSCADITAEEVEHGVDAFRKLIAKFKPKVVCFVGKIIYRWVYGKDCKIGAQAETLKWDQEEGSSSLYVVASTSGRVTVYSREERIQQFKQFAVYLNEKIKK
ncbi:uracil-DNA glycosylase-like protein [Syncephalastrum racemosum]|uniref:Uracil-DNA glycosylase-like protein n=1 Tax=Syncephalastrum racemosum TaxID=13706 RepID=A0A1X2HDY1_SYNRA|nr:uracil-DNA glycosylase-like protein [Syncephalastrum racemosum]